MNESQSVSVREENPVLTTTERAIAVVKNVLVIITCLVILYISYVGYTTIQSIGESLSQWTTGTGAK